MGSSWEGSLSLLGLKGPLGLLDPKASLDPRASWHPREPRGQGSWRGQLVFKLFGVGGSLQILSSMESK